MINVGSAKMNKKTVLSYIMFVRTDYPQNMHPFAGVGDADGVPPTYFAILLSADLHRDCIAYYARFNGIFNHASESSGVFFFPGAVRFSPPANVCDCRQ